MKLLVMGGTRFAGRAVVEAALAAGDEVTTLNRGLSRTPQPGVTAITADRTNADELRQAVQDDGQWDAVIDTWSGAPSVMTIAARLLKDRARRYCYVSTVSVYEDPLPLGGDETAPTVAADPDSDTTDYQPAKRGAELAVLREFGDRAVIGRPGLILGPYENIGRLPWWLRRIERGGRVLAPGDPARPIQYLDVRDLADWVLNAVREPLHGEYNLVSRPAHTTMGALLNEAIAVTGAYAELVWVPDKVVLDAGISPWTELPIYVPAGPDWDGVYDIGVDKAFAAGLTSRAMTDTVASTWAWLQAEGDPKALHSDPPAVGVDPAKEREVLAALG